MNDEDVRKLFNKVVIEITQNVRQLMTDLWLNWSHLGVDDSTKVINITKLIQFEKDLHHDVITETTRQLATMQAEVDKLKEETEELSRALSVDITILEWKEDVMLADYKRELEEQIADYRKQVEERRRAMDRMLEWQRDLAEKLGVSIQELSEVPLPSEDELDKLKDHLETLQAERDRRAERFLETQLEIKDIMDKLQMKPQNKFERVVVTSLSTEFKVTDLNMDRLAKLRQDLQEKYEQTNNRVLELRERLAKLWDCLEEDQIYRESFLQSHKGCHIDTENAIKDEILRCDQIKREKIQLFVANVRTKIKHMWDACMYSVKEREEFVHYTTDYFSEDTLTLHELYLDKITKFYNDHKQIFEMVQTRKDLWTKMNELENRASAPGRYNNRGGQLLKEERERKAIATNLPKIEAQLRELVKAYEAQTGKTFNVDGKPLLQYINDEWEIKKAERTNKVTARKQGLTPNTASIYAGFATSPLGKRNRTAAGLPNTADMPSKRLLVTASATKVASSVTSNHSALKRSAVTSVRRGSETTARSVHVYVGRQRHPARDEEAEERDVWSRDGTILIRISRCAGRVSGRLVAQERTYKPKRKLDYGSQKKNSKVSGSILKHKRTTSNGKRQSSSRCSINAIPSSQENSHQQKDPLMETTLLTTYTDFKLAIKKVEELYAKSNTPNQTPIKMVVTLDNINEQQISRSSMASNQKPEAMQIPTIVCHTIEERSTTSKKTPKKQAPMTPKIGKENLHREMTETPKGTLMYTPTRLTRSALKLNNDGFATPRAPLSATKANMQRQHTMTNMQGKTTPNGIRRSNTHSHMARVKNFPPII